MSNMVLDVEAKEQEGEGGTWAPLQINMSIKPYGIDRKQMFEKRTMPFPPLKSEHLTAADLESKSWYQLRNGWKEIA